MPKPIIVEGQTATNPQTKEKIVYRGGKWYPVQPANAMQGDAPVDPLTPGSESRTRVVMGLGPAVEAQKQMFKSEGWNTNAADPTGYKGGRNPLDKSWVAANLALDAESSGKPSFMGIDKQAVARKIGGSSYQDYDQASKSWESAMLPILSGAAVTPSEAQRQLRANLPQLNDTPKILSAKAKNRAMMTNAAADLAGRPRPFPRIGTWDFKGGGGSDMPKANAFAAPAAAGPKNEGAGWRIVP